MAKQITTTLTELAEWIGAPDWDKVEEFNLDYIWMAGDVAMRECQEDLDDDMDEEEAEEACEEARQSAEMQASNDLFEAWKSAVEEGADYVLDMHELELVEKKGGKYQIKPTKNVRSSLALIVDTINGVGYFRFDSVKELLDSGPYTPTEALRGHWRWATDRPAVYGTGSNALRTYERAMEHWSRYHANPSGKKTTPLSRSAMQHVREVEHESGYEPEVTSHERKIRHKGHVIEIWYDEGSASPFAWKAWAKGFGSLASATNEADAIADAKANLAKKLAARGRSGNPSTAELDDALLAISEGGDPMTRKDFCGVYSEGVYKELKRKGLIELRGGHVTPTSAGRRRAIRRHHHYEANPGHATSKEVRKIKNRVLR